MSQEANYFVLYPLIYLDRFNHRQCTLIGLINSLSTKKGYCYAKNATLILMNRCSAKSLERDLVVLERAEVIRRELIYEGKQVKERRIYVQNSPLFHVQPPRQDYGEGTRQDYGHPTAQIHVGDKDKEIEKLDIKNNSVYSLDFENIWTAYKKKGVKKTAWSAYRNLGTAEQRLAQVHVPLYIAHHEKHKKMPYLPYLSTYLNQRRWENDMPYGDDNIGEILWE